MKQSFMPGKKELFPGSDTLRSYTFKKSMAEANFALSAKLNHQLAAIFAVLQDRYAYLAIVFLFQTDIATLLKQKSAHLPIQDCFECLSPHKLVL